jgi:uncharacterized iron-regulated protein
MSKLLAMVCLLAVLTAAAFADDGVIRMKDGREITFATMMTDLDKADVVFLGEVHNDPSHHQLQLQVLRALLERKVKLTIGLEMFQADSQQVLDDWIGGKTSEEDFKVVYSKNWSFDWQLYRDIFIFARDNRIPLVALNIPKPIATKVARQGFASLTAEERKTLPGGITCELNTTYTELLKLAFGQVFKHIATQSNFTNFCEAQSLRNSAIAWHMDHYREKHPERKLVTIAGIWHAVRGGAPARLNLAETGSLRVVLPEIKELGPQNTTSKEADYLVRKQGN